MFMLIIGSHVSFKSDDQLVGSVKEALSYGSNTFMFYTGAPQNTMRKPINGKYTMDAYNLMYKSGIDPVNLIVHAPYIINLANRDNFSFNVSFLTEEIERCEELGILKMVLHPGSHIKRGVEEGLNAIVDTLNAVLNKDTSVFICLETMAGKGSELGANIDELKYIIDNVKFNEKLMVCLDTCHLNDSGIDISKFDDYLLKFDKKIGINKIGCVHVNDSKNELGSHKDRHENIGYGTIGFDNLLNVIYNKKLEGVPKILETPWIKYSDKETYAPYKFEIEMIRNKVFNENLKEDLAKSHELDF